RDGRLAWLGPNLWGSPYEPTPILQIRFRGRRKLLCACRVFLRQRLGASARLRVVRAEGFGLANVELNVPVKPETVFQSGSVAKQFTAAAVMMLVEEGKIGLDDPL